MSESIRQCACGSTKLHAKGKCMRCYNRAINATPERKERRRQYTERNREQILESYRRYNRTRYQTHREKKHPYEQEIVRVPVPGWGFLTE